MAGGGFRFGYYLGIYAAAVEAEKQPDLLLASCGGSIAAAIIQALPTDAERRAWVSSRAMFDFMRGLESTARAAITSAVLPAIRRRLDSSRARLIPDLFDDYLFELPAQLPLPPVSAHGATEIAIVGGKLLFTPADVGQPRAGRKLFAETVFSGPRATALLRGMPAPMGAPAWGDTAIAPPLVLDQAMPVADAVRISISDMFYFRCHAHASGNYMGGVIDLFPIELANRLANQVMIEMKSPFNQALAIPALRAVLGVDGNARLRHIHEQHAETWIDTSDVETELRGRGVRKVLSWRDNQIRLVVTGDYAQYVADVEAQWQYGYRRAMEAFGHAGKRPMRNATRHNWRGA